MYPLANAWISIAAQLRFSCVLNANPRAQHCTMVAALLFLLRIISMTSFLRLNAFVLPNKPRMPLDIFKAAIFVLKNSFLIFNILAMDCIRINARLLRVLTFFLRSTNVKYKLFNRTRHRTPRKMRAIFVAAAPIIFRSLLILCLSKWPRTYLDNDNACLDSIRKTSFHFSGFGSIATKLSRT